LCSCAFSLLGFIFFITGSIWVAFTWPLNFYIDNSTAMLLVIAAMTVFYMLLATSFFVCAYVIL
jgi:hypothetical protein